MFANRLVAPSEAASSCAPPAVRVVILPVNRSSPLHVYLLRALPPADTADLAASHDAVIRRCLAQMLAGGDGDMPVSELSRAQLPLSWEGWDRAPPSSNITLPTGAFGRTPSERCGNTYSSGRPSPAAAQRNPPAREQRNCPLPTLRRLPCANLGERGGERCKRRPAVHHGSLRPGRTPRRSLAGPRIGEEWQEGECGPADASPDLDAEDGQRAAPVPPGGLLETVSSTSHLSIVRAEQTTAFSIGETFVDVLVRPRGFSTSSCCERLNAVKLYLRDYWVQSCSSCAGRR
ncbi:unnamed protein product [Symbiodinium sp. CCMP2592]|nr:unnamed protein product [Symbiodinium sp. CCMP2592]